MVQAIQLLARDLATKDYKTRHSLKMMSPTEYRKFHKAEPSDQRASAHIHVGRIGACLDSVNRSIQVCRDEFGAGKQPMIGRPRKIDIKGRASSQRRISGRSSGGKISGGSGW